jgi:hypothetical protein
MRFSCLLAFFINARHMHAVYLRMRLFVTGVCYMFGSCIVHAVRHCMIALVPREAARVCSRRCGDHERDPLPHVARCCRRRCDFIPRMTGTRRGSAVFS